MKSTTKTLYHMTTGEFYVAIKEDYRIDRRVELRPAGMMAKNTKSAMKNVCSFSIFFDHELKQHENIHQMLAARNRPALVLSRNYGDALASQRERQIMLNVVQHYYPYHDVFVAKFGLDNFTPLDTVRLERKRRAIDQQHERVKRLAHEQGMTLMHRRGDKFWLVCREPMTLNEIDGFMQQRLAEAAD